MQEFNLISQQANFVQRKSWYVLGRYAVKVCLLMESSRQNKTDAAAVSVSRSEFVNFDFRFW